MNIKKNMNIIINNVNRPHSILSPTPETCAEANAHRLAVETSTSNLCNLEQNYTSYLPFILFSCSLLLYLEIPNSQASFAFSFDYFN